MSQENSTADFTTAPDAREDVTSQDLLNIAPGENEIPIESVGESQEYIISQDPPNVALSKSQEPLKPAVDPRQDTVSQDPRNVAPSQTQVHIVPPRSHVSVGWKTPALMGAAFLAGKTFLSSFSLLVDEEPAWLILHG